MRHFLLSTLWLSATVARAQSAPALPPDQCRLQCFYRLTYQPDSTDQATRTELMRLQVGGHSP